MKQNSYPLKNYSRLSEESGPAQGAYETTAETTAEDWFWSEKNITSQILTEIMRIPTGDSRGKLTSAAVGVDEYDRLNNK